ncbi:hypothetical protein D9Q81_06735 [Candidatus Korarchaeum cryptofilum]|uniref:Uncharacterized protein n=1 Tax=Candidatus Korarchaeum cryptofilum TaxID=498846 RepID=A0A3R9P9N9_9CREN|nr:hypothetical protein D9Q81_06735 [Candidatus Korarchaeum cryptofilum]
MLEELGDHPRTHSISYLLSLIIQDSEIQGYGEIF